MNYWNKYKDRVNTNGTTLREKKISNSKDAIIESFFDSTSYYLVDLLTSSTPLTSSKLDCWIVDNSKVKDQKIIIAHPDQDLNKGYLIFWKNDYWLTVQSDEEFGDIYNRGTVLRCVSSLKWLENNIIYETPFCFRIDTPSNFGVDDSKKVLVMPDERRHIIIQANEYTMKFKKDMRFIIDDRAWKIITIDKLVRGVINLVLEEDQINESLDNVELRIANYYENIKQYIIEILNPIEKLDIDLTYQVIAKVYNNGELISATPTFESSDTNILYVDSLGLVYGIDEGFANIIVSYGDISTTLLIEIISASMVNDYVVFDTPLYMNTLQTKTFSVHYENNGVIVEDSSIFSISSLDDTSTNLVEIISQSDNSCMLKAKSTIGKFKLKVRNIGNTISDEKIVEIRSIL